MNDNDFWSMLKINMNCACNLYDKKNAESHGLNVQNPKKDLETLERLMKSYPEQKYEYLNKKFFIPYKIALKDFISKPNKMLA